MLYNMLKECLHDTEILNSIHNCDETGLPLNPGLFMKWELRAQVL